MTFPTTCASCEHFRLNFGEKRGRCYGSIPTMMVSGNQSPEWLPVSLNRPACAGYRALPDGQATLEYGKCVETPGDAAKLAAAPPTAAEIEERNKKERDRYRVTAGIPVEAPLQKRGVKAK